MTIVLTSAVVALQFLLEGLQSIYRLVRELKQLHFVLEEGVGSVAVPAIPKSLLGYLYMRYMMQIRAAYS